MTLRHSPLHDIIAPLQPEWGQLANMAVPLRIPGDERTLTIRLGDASCLPRMGVKGAGAEAWLLSQGIDTLPGINGWLRTPSGMLVARLARSEFFLEDCVGGGTLQQLRQALAPAAGVTPVLRQDASLALAGPQVNALLTQVCNINFLAWQPEDRVVIMTTMAGVSVLVLWEPVQGAPRYRLWCDPTFAPYLWETLLEIAREHGGGAAGALSLLPELAS